MDDSSLHWLVDAQRVLRVTSHGGEISASPGYG